MTCPRCFVCKLLAVLLLGACWADEQPGALDLYPPTDRAAFSVPVSHFDFAQRPEFGLRYFVYKAFAHDSSAPVLLYVGNEAPIESFYNNTGAMFEAGKNLQAHIVFLEHRYYGGSLPFGEKESFTSDGLRFLTVGQAMADLSIFLKELPQILGCRGRLPIMANNSLCDVVLYGGSYGGMLAAWHRFKYPHLSIGAIASGAPVDFYVREQVQDRFRKAYLGTYSKVSETCAAQLQDMLAKLPEATHAELNRVFRPCTKVQSNSDVDRLNFYIEGAMSSLCMLDYPYAQEFVTPLPANPVQEACQILSEGSLEALFQSMSLLVNGTGKLECLNIAAELVGDATSTAIAGRMHRGSTLGAVAWNYQACTEMPFQPISSDGYGFFTPDDTIQLQQITRHCAQLFNVSTRADWLPLSFGNGRQLANQLTNTFFAENAKDPWHIGTDLLGPLHASRGVFRHIAVDGAHHQELRFTAKADGPSVKELRQSELDVVREWLEIPHGPHASTNEAAPATAFV